MKNAKRMKNEKGLWCTYQCELRVELNHKKSMTYKNVFQISDFIRFLKVSQDFSSFLKISHIKEIEIETK
jgi:hypothetical protein